MTKKILITGVTGFIGSHLASELVKRNHEIYGLIKHVPSRDMRVFKEFLTDVTLVNGDITSFLSTLNVLKSINPDVIVNLAALSPVRLSFERPFEYIQANLLGTMNIAHSILELPDFRNRQLIIASTAEVYGMQNEQPVKEDAILNPSSPYAVSKAAADMYIRMMVDSYGLNGTVMRATNSYGRKFDNSFMIEYLVTEMIKGNKIYIGAPDSIRDYMYVDDHVSAYVHAIENPKSRGDVFNASTGNGLTNKEISLKIAEKTGFDQAKIVFGSYPPGYPYRPLISDQPFILLDSTKIKTKLGWSPKVSLDDGLKKVIDYWSETLK
ncbi:MAG: NAD(P)-dependent oxidoreductase [Candidatus Aenigmarchaeota archaeon]|nr:NAD(P)-dependent oxidoreductase [Candidatus Aenigmarchaeota archaeon]